MTYYFNTKDQNCAFDLYKQLTDMLRKHDAFSCDIVILCIGSDRSTGDSLGPLIGYKLSAYSFKNVHIYGSLANTVHASNLSLTLCSIYDIFSNPFVIAIDASLGKSEHIGYITLGEGPLKPGLGVKKELPEAGDIHITGIVNSSSTMGSISLQTTRLSYIMTIADTISAAIINTMYLNNQLEPAERINACPCTQPLPGLQFLQHLTS